MTNEKELEKEIRSGLKQAPKDDACWSAVRKALGYLGEREVSYALEPGLSNEMRQYRAGRAAAVMDVMGFLERMRE